MVEINYLTKRGLKKIKAELLELKTIKRPTVAKRIDKAREFGDLSENAEYQDAKEEQGFIEGKILELEYLLKTSKIVEKPSTNHDLINIGSDIKVLFDGQEKKFKIVGATEADPLNDKISYSSPLGQSFIGKKKGAEFEAEVPRGKIKCKILEVG